jgi:hypothetical protein
MLLAVQIDSFAATASRPSSVRASLRQMAASILVFGAVFGAFGLEVAPPPTFAPNGFVFSKPFGAKVGGGRPPSPPFGAHIWRAFWRNSEQKFWRKQIHQRRR